MVLAPISIGELFDKISILHIKMRKLSADQNKYANVVREFWALHKIASEIEANFDKNSLYKDLLKINTLLWTIEEQKRQHEKEKKFDDNFIQLARQVYLKNDERASIKRKINEIYNSQIIEEKSHS